MGGMESTIGFYNDRKIIKYDDGTTEYPGINCVPPNQVWEWQILEAEKKMSVIRKKRELAGEGNYLRPSDYVHPEEIPFNAKDFAHYIIEKEKETQRYKSHDPNTSDLGDKSYEEPEETDSETDELLSADKGDTGKVRFRAARSKSRHEDSESASSSSYLSFKSAFALLDKHYRAEKRAERFRKYCPVQLDCGNVFGRIRNFRKRQVHDENEAAYSLCARSEEQELARVPIGVKSSPDFPIAMKHDITTL